LGLVKANTREVHLMRKVFLAAVGVALLIGGSVAFARTAPVEITKSGFSAHDVAVQGGDAVSWKNSDTTAHEVAVAKTDCNLSLQPAQSGTCTFATPGTFTFNDPTMKGSEQKGSPFAGTLSVAQNTRAVSIATSRSLMIFGDAITLSGTVSSKQAGETVTITAQPKGEPASTTQVTTTAGGTWSLQVQPRIRTTYQATFDNAASAQLTVNVRPRITLQKVGRNSFLVVVLAQHSMAGKMIDVARWTGNGWTTVSQAQLQSIARTSTVAVGHVTSFVSLGTKLRVFLPATQAAPDYVDGHSNFVFK
jgi:plastocyanin